MSVNVRVLSFGKLHPRDEPPAADVVFDVSGYLRDPHIDPRMRQLTGADPEVAANVLGTPDKFAIEHGLLSIDTMGIVNALVSMVSALAVGAENSGRRTVSMAIACAGGRHRSVVLTEEVAARIRAIGFADSVEVEHLDLGKPVVAR